MGIPGLTTYINHHSHQFMNDFQLFDTDLVIDGNSLASNLHIKSGSSCAFGGDYDKFNKTVEKFFEDLQQCNVRPIVLLDGGIESKKMNTILRRTLDKIKMVSRYTYRSGHEYSVIHPSLIKESFKQSLHAKNIKFVQTVLEADNDIATVAKFLDCPILSFDSDFYIYDAPYIPYFTLDNGVTLRRDGKGYMINCKIYKAERLFNSTSEFDKSVLPLLAALLGNDYINSNIFTKFFRNLKLPKTSHWLYNEQQRKIHAVINWLRNHTLDTAIFTVIDRIPPQERNKVINNIELVISAYRTLSPRILLILGYGKDHVEQFIEQTNKDPYNFNQTNSVQNKKQNYCKSRKLCNNNLNEDSIHEILPQWFLDEFHDGHFPTCYIDFLIHQIHVLTVSIENVAYPSISYASLSIIKAMYKLITSGMLIPYKPLTCVIRKMNSYENKIVECPDSILGESFPSLYKLREVPKCTLKKIMDEIMGIIPEMKLEELINSWQIYIGTIIFWLKQELEPMRNYTHATAILFAMLFDIIDTTIGYYRKKDKFMKTYHSRIQQIEKEKKNKIDKDLPMNVSLEQAINEVTQDDCLMAAPFFISNFYTDFEIVKNPRKYDITIVHIFNMFQNCLKRVLYLNALLDYPYEQPAINRLFNGTLIYNLYNHFKCRKNVDLYITHVLQKSPSLLRVIKILMRKVKNMCNEICILNYKEQISKRSKKKNKCKVARNTNLEKEKTEKEGKEEYFEDNNNPFFILTKMCDL